MVSRGLPLPRSPITFFDARKVLIQPQPQHAAASKDHRFPCYNKPSTAYQKAYTTEYHQIQAFNNYERYAYSSGNYSNENKMASYFRLPPVTRPLGRNISPSRVTLVMPIFRLNATYKISTKVQTKMSNKIGGCEMITCPIRQV